MKSCVGLSLLFACVPVALAAGDTHPFSVLDMLAMDRISDPRVSPDGKTVAFSVRVTDMASNRGRSDIYLSNVDDGMVRRLKTHDANDTQPRWSTDGASLYFLSTRSGSSQVWRLSMAGGEPEQITRLPLDVDALEVSPCGKLLIFGLAVFPGKTPE